MIELLIAALIQLGTLTGTPTETTTAAAPVQATGATPTGKAPGTGGTGSWDDGN